MHLRTLLHYLLGRLVVGLVALMAKIHPPYTYHKERMWGDMNDTTQVDYIIYDDLIYYKNDNNQWSLSWGGEVE
jgi:hypothetical protein